MISWVHVWREPNGRTLVIAQRERKVFYHNNPTPSSVGRIHRAVADAQRKGLFSVRPKTFEAHTDLGWVAERR